ncbi:uncharacterized protein STAUR_5262 [Stigmatella aurantiaca DW4/3-1]|uniref:Uncharacterized protein n=1 Tax=Stigmatella aurantiaca (strain DW4/3-1) TaxID=378806 RepID=E3FLE1_STIAD|nr:uncharacterized protein STAUR_5262 [Stigmatella aurantiaca DW4/3-1]
MTLRLLRSVCVWMGMTAAIACGGMAPEDASPGEAEATPVAANASESASAAPIPPGCGYFKQRCCADNVCYSGLECDPSTKTCLH